MVATGLLRLRALKSEPKQMFAKETAFELLTPNRKMSDSLGINRHILR